MQIADTVLIYESDFDPAIDLQAMERVHLGCDIFEGVVRFCGQKCSDVANRYLGAQRFCNFATKTDSPLKNVTPQVHRFGQFRKVKVMRFVSLCALDDLLIDVDSMKNGDPPQLLGNYRFQALKNESKEHRCHRVHDYLRFSDAEGKDNDLERRSFKDLAAPPRAADGIVKETGIQEMNRFLARTSEELDWFEAFDRTMLRFGSIKWSVSELLMANNRYVDQKYTDENLNLNEEILKLKNNKEKVLARPKDMKYGDGLTEGQWGRVIKGLFAVGCKRQIWLAEQRERLAEQQRREDEEKQLEARRQAAREREEKEEREVIDRQKKDPVSRLVTARAILSESSTIQARCR